MKPGQVVSIRVNPKDCMSVIDAVVNNGLYTKGMSYPAMVSILLSSCLESMRQTKNIPTRDGFEYLEMMGPYLGQGRNRRSQSITEALASNSSFQVRPVRMESSPIITAPVLPQQTQPSAVGAALAEAEGMTVREAQVELTELCAKKDLAEDGQYTWTPSLEERFQLCYKIVYPEG